jgi:hypothetical protein
MIFFPTISPTSRRVTQGQYAVKRFNSIAGTGTSRVYSSQPFGSLMDLSFDNVPDSTAMAICDCYEQTRGSYSGLTLPSSLWSGFLPELAVMLKRDYTWRFAEQPQVVSGAPGVSSVSVKLEGQRDI